MAEAVGVGRRSSRSLVLAGFAAAAAVALAGPLARAPEALGRLPLHDFVEYWAAGRLNASGENPYDPERIHQLERSAGRDADGILMWNPPWTLPLVMPFGLLDCRAAHLLWLGLNLAALVFCADRLWRLSGGDPVYRWAGWVVALTFLPSYFALVAGQITPLVLLGAVGFLDLQHRGRDALSGAAAVLLAIKPHLAYLFWLALLLWAVSGRRWRVLGGGAAAGLALVAAALLCNPDVLGQYWHTLTTSPPAQYRSPTLGTVLRLASGEDNFRLQFLALVPGLAWFVPYWLRHRRAWSWEERMPALLLVSVLTAAYGAWPFDLVLLLVPVLHLAAAVARDGRPRVVSAAVAAAAAFAGLGGVLLAREAEYLWFLWMTPAVLAAHVVLGRFTAAPTPTAA